MKLQQIAAISLLLPALASCAAATDEPEREPPQTATAYANDTPEGACLSAVAVRAPGAGLQVTAPGSAVVGVTADDALWTCRMNADGSVAAVIPPERRP